MAKQLGLLLALTLSWVAFGTDVKVKLDGYSQKVYVDGQLWFRSGVLGLRHHGTWFSNEGGVQTPLRVLETIGKKVEGSDSIGSYSGVK